MKRPTPADQDAGKKKSSQQEKVDRSSLDGLSFVKKSFRFLTRLSTSLVPLFQSGVCISVYLYCTLLGGSIKNIKKFTIAAFNLRWLFFLSSSVETRFYDFFHCSRHNIKYLRLRLSDSRFFLYPQSSQRAKQKSEKQEILCHICTANESASPRR